MKKILIVSVMIITSLQTVNAFSANRMCLAVMDFNAKGVSKVIANAITDLMRAEIVDTGRFIVVERSQMDVILKEQGFQQTGCTDSSCAVEIGKLLSANKVLLGEVNQIESSTIITVRIVDVEKGVAEFSSSEKLETINSIDKTVKVLAKKLTLRITGQVPVDYNETPAGYYLRGFVPGWAQFYGGSRTKGWIFSGLAAGAAGFSGYCFYDFNKKHKAYNDLDSTASNSQFDSRHNDEKKAADMVNLSLYIFAGIYAANWIDVLFVSEYKPDAAAAVLRPQGRGDLFFSFSPYLYSHEADETVTNFSVTIRF